MGFSQNLGQVADAVDEIGQKFDLAAAKKADAEDAVALAKIRAQALTAIGTEAPEAAEQARNAAEQIKKQRLTQLKGRRGQMYALSFDQRMAQFEGQLTEHSIKQADVADRGAAAARADISVQLAVDGFSDPDVLNSNMATGEKEFRHANRGMAEDEINRRWSIEKSKAHVAIVKSIMTTDPDNPVKAEKWIEDHADDILPEHEPELRKSLQPLLDDQQGDADFARSMAFAGGNPDASAPEGEDDHNAPTPSVPAPKGKAPANLTQHLVGPNAKVTSTYTAARARGQHNALDIAAPEGSPIRPPMSGRVSKVWLDTEHGGGWSMLIQHPNGYVTGYAHMKSRPPVEAGTDVDSTTIVGSVGQTGHATGPHLHFTVRKAGQKVDPQTVDYSAMAGVSSKGAPPLVDPEGVKWKEGELPRYTADKNMEGQALDAVYKLATKENWSRQRYDRAIAKAREFAGVSEQLYNAQYDDLRDRVWEKIAGLDGGDGLTNISQIGSDYGLLKGQDKLTVSNLIQANKKRLQGDGDIKANGEEYTDWVLMAAGSANERDAFLKADFRANHNMTAAERTRLSLRQQQMRNDVNGTLSANIDTVMTVVNRYAPEAGFDVTKANKSAKEDRQRRGILIDRTTALIQKRQQELGRPLNDVEIDGIVRSQVVSITREGKKTPLYLLRTQPKTPGSGPDTLNVDEVYASIPTTVKNSIVRSLQRRGVAPTPQLVIEAYLEGSK